MRPRRRESLEDWRAGDAWLGGGTWLFSEPQPALRRLLDLDSFGWAPLEVGEHGLAIAATCRIAELYALATPPDWLAAPLYFDDVHGTPAYRKHMTYLCAEQIRRELADGAGK